MRGLTRASPHKDAADKDATNRGAANKGASNKGAADKDSANKDASNKGVLREDAPLQHAPQGVDPHRLVLHRTTAHRIGPRRAALITGGTVVGFAAVGGLVLAGCDTGSQGVRKEGPARTSWAPEQADSPGSYVHGTSPTSTSAKQKVDAVALLKKDPKVSEHLKANLKPCSKSSTKDSQNDATPSPAQDAPQDATKDAQQEAKKGSAKSQGYPIDVAYGRLTGSAASDLVVNVMTCTEGFGLGSYVYRKVGGTYENVFADERPPVYADTTKGSLRVTKLVYASNDSVCCPSSEDVTTYRWAETRREFLVTDRKTKNVSEDESPAPDDGTEG